MKLEIEITEEEIKSAIERKVRTAVADQTNNWGTDRFIKDTIAAKWRDIVAMMIEDELRNAPKMREKIMAALEAKLKAQLTAALKAAA